MLNNITIGQFFPGDSLLHRMDPRVNPYGLLLYLPWGFIFLQPLVTA